MIRKNLSQIIVIAIILVLGALVIGLLVFIQNQPAPVRGVPNLTSIKPLEPSSELWGVNFPNQYSTLRLTKDNNARTKYGGSEKRDKPAEDPRLVRLFAGYGFSKAYTEDRGHMNSVTDVNETPRVNDKTPGTCYSCKSSDNPKLWSEMGMEAYDAMPFKELGKQIHNPIGCANCHDSATMQLAVTNPALDAALKAQGKDWRTFTRQEMRTVVCANCHVEYYFKGDGKVLTFPWENGTTAEQIDAYYDETAFTDWKHPDSGTDMIKIQHPEYELYTAGSTHYKAGVACADCHMPYTRDGAAKFSTHDVKSPMLNPEKTCATCHTDVEYVKARVGIIQDSVHSTLIATEDALVAAIDAIKASAADANADQALIAEARTLHRKAQLRWDIVAAENSMGFHNPEEALRILAAATDLARQAEIKAMQAIAK